MAYMNRDTFDIINNSNIEVYLDDDFFEIDDYIAKPVQTLNRKGYTTRFCCSGHPFETVNEIILLSPEDEDPDSMPGIVQSKLLPDGTVSLTVRQALDCEAYISFEPSICLPESAPEGWRRFGDNIRCFWPYSDDPLTCMLSVYEAMRKLTEWADSLPDMKEKNCE